MIVIANECCDCGLPCIHGACPYYAVRRCYCDECREETDLWYFDGQELCIDCITKRLEKVE